MTVPPPGLSSTRPARERGVALVLVLAFVSLLTLLVVAFFSQALTGRQLADSSANQTRADLLARGALDVIVGDLKEEIRVGSDPSNGGTAGGPLVYLPKALSSPTPPANENLIQPARIGVPPLPAPAAGASPFPHNLLRRSARAADANATPSPNLPGIPATRASAVNSATDTSLNGRKVTAERWNSHYLLPRKKITEDLDPNGRPIPDSVPVDLFIPPDWVFVTRQGPKVLTNADLGLAHKRDLANPDYVVGRYAYAVYDEGGLLDVNVAGYPGAATLGQIARKGPLVFADLAPVFRPADRSAGQVQVDNLIGWRNYGSTQPAGTLAGNYSIGTTAATRYVTAMLGRADGFLNVLPLPAAPPVTGNSRTDQAFLTRQDLLRWRQTANLSQDVLPYLGTFSRERNAPSFTPAANRPKVGASGSGHDTSLPAAGQDDVFNPSLANFRGADGQPFVKRRFPLSRLAWLTSDGPAANLPQSDARFNREGTTTNIQTHFGLSWAGDGWVYDHRAPNDTDPFAVYTLAEIRDKATTGGITREPDFFELLQAAIHVGSLAKDADTGPGQPNSDTPFAKAPTKVSQSPAQNVWQRDRSLTYHILKIGACIMDQADADSYPTMIKVLFPPPTPPNLQTPPQEIYGVENLPYLNKLIFKGYWELSSKVVSGWLRPSFWNPHRDAASPAAEPNQFRLVMEKGQMFYGGKGRNPDTNKSAGTGLPGEAGAIPLPTDTPYLAFNTATQKFEESKGLRAVSVDASASSAGWSAPPAVAPALATSVGLLFTKANWPDSPSFGATPLLNIGLAPATESRVTLAVEYRDKAGVWRRYQRVEEIKFSTGVKIDYSWRGGPSGNNAEDGTDAAIVLYKVDPRTDRFGLTAKLNANSLNRPLMETHNPAGGSQNAYTDRHHFMRDNLDPTQPLATGFKDVKPPNRDLSHTSTLVRNKEGSGLSYRDADNVNRLAEGAYTEDADIGNDGWPLIPGITGAPNPLDSRPVVLNRPFRAVGELGYAFRDLPWKNLDFFTKDSGDAALLDVFCVEDTTGTELLAGRVNPNTRNQPVLAALLAGSLLREMASPATVDVLSGTDADNIAFELAELSAAQPIASRAELVTRLSEAIKYEDKKNEKIKTRREAAIRALADTANVRTWNLLVDVVAQAGRFPPNATDLRRFNVEGERRYWLHVALDRYTGEVIDQSLEPVYD